MANKGNQIHEDNSDNIVYTKGVSYGTIGNNNGYKTMSSSGEYIDYKAWSQ